MPVIGLAWWGLDFPFMKRYSREYLIKHPEKRGDDLIATRKACEKFRYTPVSVMNFVEGTRFTQAKHDKQKSPYQHLLVPKAGGAAFVLDAMGDSIDTLVDVTIAYPAGAPTFWDFLCGRVPEIQLDISTRSIPEHLKGRDYSSDAEHRRNMKDWLGELWRAKDERLSRKLEKQVSGRREPLSLSVPERISSAFNSLKCICWRSSSTRVNLTVTRCSSWKIRPFLLCTRRRVTGSKLNFPSRSLQLTKPSRPLQSSRTKKPEGMVRLMMPSIGSFGRVLA